MNKKVGSIKLLNLMLVTSLQKNVIVLLSACVFGVLFVCCNVQEHAEFVTCLIHQYSVLEKFM